MSERKTRIRVIIAAGVALAVIAGGSIAWYATHRGPKMVYTSQGYGGYVPADSLKKQKASKDPLQKAVNAYNSGKYKQAEAEAMRIINKSSGSKNPKVRRKAVEARYVLAFSAARTKKMDLARNRFLDMKKEASELPDKGKQSPIPGSASPTLEEEAAYQHAVCTAALGDKKAAEAEYMKFMNDYPESPLVHGAATRIEKLHNGKMPPEAEAAWTRAKNISQKRQEAREKAEKLKWAKCGPLCLAEILRQNGKTIDSEALASELKTTEEGTSLLALSKAAEKHGLSAKGVALTAKGFLYFGLINNLYTSRTYVPKLSADGMPVMTANRLLFTLRGIRPRRILVWTQFNYRTCDALAGG